MADDQFNILTLEECERHFAQNYENNIEQLTESKDKLSLLRSCIELLTRLEFTPHNHFAGRVLIFLAKVVPFYDQSGVNLRSDCSYRELPKSVKQNLKLIFAKRDEKEKQISQTTERDIDEGEILSDDSNEPTSPTLDYKDTMYEKFWKTQHILNIPNSLYDKSTWAIFRGNLDLLVGRLDGKRTDIRVWNLTHNYMTDSKSFDLQTNDVNMLRCFLVQILIIFQYLELTVDTRPENFVLDKTQTSWLAHTTKKISAILETLPNKNEGNKFLKFINRIRQNEEMWNQWKNEKCKEPKRAAEGEEEDDGMLNMYGTYHKRRKISDELVNAKAYDMHVIGSPEMIKLWNMSPAQKYNPPDLGKYLNIPLEKQSESFKDPNYSFRVLRLLRKSPHFFAPSTAVIQSLDGYLKAAVTRYQS